MRWLFALALGLAACVDFDPSPRPDAPRQFDSGGSGSGTIDAALPDAAVDAPADATLVEQ